MCLWKSSDRAMIRPPTLRRRYKTFFQCIQGLPARSVYFLIFKISSIWNCCGSITFGLRWSVWNHFPFASLVSTFHLWACSFLMIQGAFWTNMHGFCARMQNLDLTVDLSAASAADEWWRLLYTTVFSSIRLWERWYTLWSSSVIYLFYLRQITFYMFIQWPTRQTFLYLSGLLGMVVLLSSVIMSPSWWKFDIIWA